MYVTSAFDTAPFFNLTAFRVKLVCHFPPALVLLRQYPPLKTIAFVKGATSYILHATRIIIPYNPAPYPTSQRISFVAYA